MISALISLPFFDIFIGGLTLGLMYTLISLGFNLQYGVTRIFNVAHGEFLMLGSYLAYFCFTLYGLNIFYILSIVGSLMFVLGVILQRVIFNRIVHRAKSGEELEFSSLLLSFGLSFIIQNAALFFWSADFRSYTYLNQPIYIAGQAFPLNRIVVAVISAIFCVILYCFLNFTYLGLAIKAVATEPVGARVVGINIAKVYAVSFGLGVFLSGIAGSLISMLYTITPFMGGTYLFVAFLVTILGGLGNFAGSSFSGILLGYVTYITMRLIHPSLTLVIYYAIFVLILIISPRGVFVRRD